MGEQDATDQQQVQAEKLDKLARDVLNLCRNTLLIHLCFMDRALSMLTPQAAEELDGPMTSDGETLWYDAKKLLLCYRQDPKICPRDYLHTVLHCVFRHAFVSPLIERDCWNLACDVAVENVMNELQLSFCQCTRAAAQQTLLREVRSHVKRMTAEHIYAYFRDKHLPEGGCELLRRNVLGDDHTAWYPDLLIQSRIRLQSVQTVGGQNGMGQQAQRGDSGMQSGMGVQRLPDCAPSAAANDLAQQWKDIAERMQMDLESFDQQRGDGSGSLTQNLREVTREKVDYTAFLKKFAVMGEALKVNDDEFDYIFYTYGLSLYHNMPLIEPLEYKEVKRIREFVIAIDTSGSVSGDLVQRFVQKTYNILKQEESFFTKINIHILQCDAEIQEDAKITSQEEFDEYLRHMKLRGLGGTDFRPVFQYIEKLRKEKELTNLRGMIYFTDGYGIFPSVMPDYETVFVFVGEDEAFPETPVWATWLVLRSNEIA